MTQQEQDIYFLGKAIALAQKGVETGEGGPFGCVVVQNGQIVGVGNNKVTSHCDPTAHAEVVAIRDACHQLQTFQLNDCQIYTSCEPCPMCLGAIYWARPQRVIFAATKTDAASVGFDDAFIYDEIVLEPQDRKIPFIRVEMPDKMTPFQAWSDKEDKEKY